MEKTFYTVIAGAPGSLLVEPPDPTTVVVSWSEHDSQEDGRGWVLHSAPGVTSRYFKERYALTAATGVDR